MSGIIVEWINRLFPKKECRVLFIGLDAAGKTTILYKLKLGEVVTTIPTIGFNVETITHKGMEITAWDVGGCDKIRPLWRHYYQNTDALVLVVDSNDRERMGGNDHNEKWSTVQGLFIETLKADELRNCKVLIYLNKQDLPHAMTPAEFKTFFNIDGLIANRTIPPFHYHIQPCCACAGDGLYEGLDWLVHAVTEARDKKPGLPSAESADPPPAPSIESEVEKEKTKSSNPQENLLSEWLEREDEPDEIFLEKLANYTLDSWDHYTHLRIAWLFLQRLGRREGMSKIFKSIRLFIENSPRTRTNPSLKEGEVPKRGTTFHETMTYFWVHMVHYAMAATILPENTFKVFLLMNPQLCNGGLFLTFYSKKHILFNPTARTEVVLPDLKPLPSIIPSPSNTKRQVVIGEGVSVASLQKNIGDLSDKEFYNLFELHQLTAFGHEVKMRIIYLLLCRQGRGKGGTDTILRLLEDFEGKISFHLTINYFWIQLISFHIMNLIAQSKKGKGDEKKWKKENFGKLFDSSPLGTVSSVGPIIPFSEFFKEKTVEDLHDSLLYQK